MMTKRLGEVAEILTGLIKVKGEDGAERRRILNVRDLDDGRAAPLEALEEIILSPRQSRHAVRYEVQPLDVLLTCRGTVNKVALVGSETQGALASGNLMIIRAKNIDARLIFAFLSSSELRKRLESMATGSTIKAITLRVVAELEIPVPPRDVQQDLGDLIEATEQQYRLGIAATRARRELGHRTVVSCLTTEATRWQ